MWRDELAAREVDSRNDSGLTGDDSGINKANMLRCNW